MATQHITFRRVHILQVTTKAVLIYFPSEGSEYWLPKSQIIDSGRGDGTVTAGTYCNGPVNGR